MKRNLDGTIEGTPEEFELYDLLRAKRRSRLKKRAQRQAESKPVTNDPANGNETRILEWLREANGEAVHVNVIGRTLVPRVKSASVAATCSKLKKKGLVEWVAPGTYRAIP
jgi:hypothetical protein